MLEVVLRLLALLVAGITIGASPLRAQTVTMPDGRTLPFEQLPLAKKLSNFRFPSEDKGWFVLMATPAFCPTWWAYSTGIGNAERDRQEASCTNASRSLFEDYPKSERDRCGCVPVIQGPLHSLKAVSDLVNDPDNYLGITLVVTRQNSRERLRGFFVRSGDGNFRILNEKRQPVCAGAGLSQSGQLSFTCFSGKVGATGTYQLITISAAKRYGLGAFELSDGARLNIAVGIVDRDLAALHPDFPK